MTSKKGFKERPGHDICNYCGTGPLKGIERLVGICYNCNRMGKDKQNNTLPQEFFESPKYECSFDESTNENELEDSSD